MIFTKDDLLLNFSPWRAKKRSLRNKAYFYKIALGGAIFALIALLIFLLYLSNKKQSLQKRIINLEQIYEDKNQQLINLPANKHYSSLLYQDSLMNFYIFEVINKISQAILADSFIQELFIEGKNVVITGYTPDNRLYDFINILKKNSKY